MRYLSVIPFAARRVTAVIAAASVAGLIVTTAAFAATSSGTARTSAAAVHACTTADLGAWVAADQGNGAAGSIYFPLQFTNVSRHTCSMRGFPGVSAIDRNGHQLGSPGRLGQCDRPAYRATRARRDCARDTAVERRRSQHGTRVRSHVRRILPAYLPARSVLRDPAFFSLEVCSHTGPVYMHVGPILPGVGTIYG